MEKFNVLNLINGDACQVSMINGSMLSRANYKQGNQKEYDIVPFLMQEACLINGDQKDLTYFLKLSIDDYKNITNSLEAAVSNCI